MGDFSIQISSKLINQLAEVNDQPKRKAKKTKPKVPQQHKASTVHDYEQPKPVTESQMQPPFYFPIPQQPAQEAGKAELEAIRSVLKESEKVLEKLEKQEKSIGDEVTERAKDLMEKEFKIGEAKPMPCSLENDAWMKCYKENINDTLKCSGFVRSFLDCARRVRQ